MIRALIQKLAHDRIGELVAGEATRIEVKVLREEREVLAKVIARLDERIAGLDGKRRGRPPKPASAIPVPTLKPRRRRRLVHAPGETLREMAVKALDKAGGPVKAATLVDLVKQLGYRTTAKPLTLLTSIYHVLADSQVFRKMGKGVFGLRKEPAPERGSERTKKGLKVGAKRASRSTGSEKTPKKARKAEAVEERKSAAAEVKPG